MQNPQAIPGLFPLGLVPIDLVKCWSSLFTVQGCVLAISNSFFSGKFENVEAACCKVFSTLDANCWPHMFPLNPFFPPLLKDNCARIIPNSPAHNCDSRTFPPGLVPIDLVKCWSSLFTVQGCVLAISNSFFSGKFENVEAACCKVFSTLDANCWPHMFPLNPFFPPLLKDNCSRIIPNSPAHN
ncbi:hypothetical protein YC2023_015530 [Brassica napus]